MSVRSASIQEPPSDDRVEERASSSTFVLHNISKRFGNQWIIKGLSTSFEPGELALLLGANGAGKSTLLRICAALLRADSGSLKHGFSRSAIGYLGHEPMIFAHLTVRENLELFSALYNLRLATDYLMQRWKLEPHAEKRVIELSRGLQMRVALARTLMSNPSLLLLDEPTSALDEESVSSLMSAISGMALQESRAGIAIVATHDIERVREFANRVILLEDGRIRKDSKLLESNSVSKIDACATVIDEYRRRNR